MTAPSSTGRSVLIVDDDDNLRSTIREYAQGLGMDVWEASNGLEALWIVQHQRLELVLLDLKMPRLHGFETLRHVREVDPGIRVVLGTGDSSDETRERLASLNLEVLLKPLSISDLERVFSAA